MPKLIPQIIGLAAVFAFLLSYLQKTRRNIIILNVTSRLLYILQYLLLGAISGAALDILGALSSILAGRKHTPFIQKHLKTVIISMNLLIVAAGVAIAVINRSFLDILPIFGVILHTSAFWMTSEKIIRRISLLGSPFWFVYNLVSRAYGSAIGDLLSMCSIVIAMIRYRRYDGISDKDLSDAKKGSEI